MEEKKPYRMGLDAKQLASIINTSSGRCWSSDTYNPVPGVIEGIPSSRDYQGGFGSALMAKVGFRLLRTFSIFISFFFFKSFPYTPTSH